METCSLVQIYGKGLWRGRIWTYNLLDMKDLKRVSFQSEKWKQNFWMHHQISWSEFRATISSINSIKRMISRTLFFLSDFLFFFSRCRQDYFSRIKLSVPFFSDWLRSSQSSDLLMVRLIRNGKYRDYKNLFFQNKVSSVLIWAYLSNKIGF